MGLSAVDPELAAFVALWPCFAGVKSPETPDCRCFLGQDLV